jgi:hypothetical protein
LKNVGWSSSLPVFDADRDGDDVLGAQIARGACGNLRDQATIGEAASANFNGFEQAGESAARTNGFAEISMRENDGFSVRQVCCHHGHGNSEIFEALRFEHLLDEVTKTVIAGEAQTGNAPSADVAKANLTANSNDARQRRTAGIRRAKNATDARAGDIRNWYVILFEDLQNA